MSLRSASLEAIEREYLALQRRLLKGARSNQERLRIQRLIAKDILNGAYYNAETWGEFERALRRVERLGYEDVQDRLHAASLFVRATGRFPDKFSQAWAMLEEAERRVRRVRRGHCLREESLESIARLRKEVTGEAP